MRHSRNILFLIADDWSPLGPFYGQPQLKMPHLETLTAKGVVFDHAYCTTPTCAASRASILTGLHSHYHGQYGHCHGRHTFRTLNLPNLPALLADSGIYAGIIGKKHTLPDEVYRWGYDRGKLGGLLPPHQMREQIRGFFEDCGDRPFHLHIAVTEPHQHGSDYANCEPCEGIEPVRYHPGNVDVPPWLPDRPEVREDLAEYYTAISRMDARFGIALEELERARRTGDTLILVLSDHGMPQVGAKASSYVAGHHCPLIVVDPTCPGGTRNRAMVSWVDLLPTLLEWHGLAPPEKLHGRSFLPILHETEPKGWDEVFLSHSFHGVTEHFPYRTVLTRRWRYTRHLFADRIWPIPPDLHFSRTWQTVEKNRLARMGARKTRDVLFPSGEVLFDLQKDPAEAHNLAGDPDCAELLAAMRKRLRQLRARTEDLWYQEDCRRSHLETIDWEEGT